MKLNSVSQHKGLISQRTGFFKACGGRKQLNGYLAVALISLMAHPLDASFHEYAFAIIASLGLTSGLVALEDGISKSNTTGKATVIHATKSEHNGVKGEENAVDLVQTESSLM